MSDGKELIDDGLTDEERLALAEEDGTDEPVDELDEGADDATDDDEGKEGDDDATDGAGDADPDAAADPEDAAADDEDAPAIPSQPVFVADAPQDADVKLAEIGTKKGELIAQFDDGDITAKEYQEQLDTLSKQEREIEMAIMKADMAADMEKQRKMNEWVSTVNNFLDANKMYREKPRLYRALDQEVKEIAVTPEAANWDGNQILKKAHENLAAEFGFTTEAPAAEKPGKTKIPKPDLPPNLSKVPAADNNDMGAGKYAALDRLASTNPIAYEEAIAKMSDSERDSYLSA